MKAKEAKAVLAEAERLMASLKEFDSTFGFQITRAQIEADIRTIKKWIE